MKTFFIIVTALILFSGCEKREYKELKVGMSPWPGYEALYIALQKDFFDNPNIKIVRYETPTDSFKALRDGLIDVAAFTADEVLHFAEVRNEPKIFLILDVSNGADAIVAHKNIKTINELKGATIGVERSALGEYMLKRVMDFSTNTLTQDDIRVKNIEISHQVDAFRDGEVDAVVTYEPFKSILLEAGAHVIFDSTKMPNEIVDILVASKETLKSKKSELVDLGRGWFKAQAYIKSHKKESMKIMAKNEHIDVETFTKSYSDLFVPTLEDNIRMLGSNKDVSLFNALDKLSFIMYKNRTTSTKISVESVVSDEIVKEIRR